MTYIQFNQGWALTTLLLSILVHPSYQSRISARQSNNLQWGPCVNSLGSREGIVCANLTVPLDWTNPTNGQSAYLYVAKRPARNGSPLGTIFTNPGGPGGSGIDYIARGSELISNITGGAFDIVSWDPRGVGYTIPRITCFNADQSGYLGSGPNIRVLVRSNLIQSTLNASSSGPSPADTDIFLANATNVENYIKSFVQTCVDKNQDNLKYVGTVATAKDLVALADAIEGPGSPIRYWGFSYGTVIGSYLLDLFPGRVGRIILDGVVDATEYSQSSSYQRYADSVQDADKALQTFFDACAAAGPTLCPIASPGDTGSTLKQWANDLIDAAYTTPNHDAGITANIVRYALTYAESPDQWDLAVELLSSMYSDLHNPSGSSARSIDHLKRLIGRSVHDKRQMEFDPAETYEPSGYAITCGDSADNKGTTTTDVFKEVVRVTKEVSNIHGPLALAWYSNICHLWPSRAVERHPNPGSPKLANPVLVIGNTYDPVTPIASARKLVTRLNAAGSKQAVLIQHDGSGHTSTAMDSACTYDIIRKYFVEGVVPGDTLCGTNFRGFSRYQNTTDHSVSTSIISSPLPLASVTGQASSGISATGPISTLHLLSWSGLAIFLGSLIML